MSEFIQRPSEKLNCESLAGTTDFRQISCDRCSWVGADLTIAARGFGALLAASVALMQPAAAQDYAAECRRLAGSPDEPSNPGKIGVALYEIDSVRAITTCTAAREALGYAVKAVDPAAAYRLSRAYVALRLSSCPVELRITQ